MRKEKIILQDIKMYLVRKKEISLHNMTSNIHICILTYYRKLRFIEIEKDLK